MKKLSLLLVMLAMLLLSACERKQLAEPHSHHNLIINAHIDSLGMAQLLSCKPNGYTTPGEPKTTKYIFYEKNSQKVAFSGEFDGLQGGIYAEEGLYDVLLFTTDFNELDANFFRGLNQHSTAETYTRQSATQEDTRTDEVKEVYMVEPDPTFSTLIEDVLVFYGEEDKEIEVELTQKSYKYYLTIRATGLQNIHSAKMNISGMYTTAFLTSDEHRMDEAGTQSLDLEIRYDQNATAEDKAKGKGSLYGEFWSFGPHQRESIANSITLYFINGDVITKKLNDLTGQIKTLTKGGEIIVEEVIEIKGPPGGFQPGVGEWNDTNVDLIL